MKKHNYFSITFIIFIVIVFSLASCGQDAKNIAMDTAMDTAVPEGFIEYANENYGFRIYYPIEWMVIDGEIDNDVWLEALKDTRGEEIFALYESMGMNLDFASAIYWFDFDHADEDFVPNTNLYISDAEGATQNDLKSPEFQKEFQEMFEQQYAELYGSLATVYDLRGRAFKDNYFIVYKLDVMADNYSCYQAITVIGSNTYTITNTAPIGKLDDFADDFEKMLSTLALIN